MRIKYILLLIGLLFFASQPVAAQTISIDNLQNVKISQLSDEQILAIWSRFQSSGISEEMAYQQLQQRGMPPSEIDALKKRIGQLQAGGKLGQKTQVKRTPDSIPEKRAAIPPTIPAPAQKPLPVYGYDFFTNTNLTFEPNLRIATPKNYVLGPDDEVVIVVSGLNETTVTRKITPDGNIQVPYAGLVYLNGLTIEQAYTTIRNRLTRIYPAISSGQTRVNVSLGNVRSIRVTIIGQAKLPGSYTLSSLSTLFNALYLSQGPSQNGSLRNIELIRNNSVIRTIDLYDFLQKGLFTDNVALQDQDVIRYQVYQKRVSIAGAVKNPSTYELKETETLQNLLDYAGGFADDAYRSLAKVSQIGEKERNLRDVPASLFDSYLPRNADSIYFEKVLARFQNRVFIAGAIYRPGMFELTPGLSLMELIQKADGLRDDAFLTRGYIKRTSPDLQKEVVSFDLSKIRTGAERDILLSREDSVMILSTSDLTQNQSVAIDGYVRMPGTFTFRQGMTLQDIITMAGGFSTAAASHRIEVSRILKDTRDVMANQLVKTFTIELDSALYSNNNQLFELQPLDYIYVPRLVNYRSIGNVTVSGEVLFPGSYSIQKRDETAPEFIQRAGGITPFGSLQYTQIYRNGIRVDADLSAKDSKANSGLIVMPGDSLVIPRQNPFVEVSGAVNTPQLLRFVSSNFKYYINAAGGVKENALLKRAYIQYPNGINRPVTRFLIFKNYPKVDPGSKIIVPENSNPIKLKLGFGEISAITSAITALIGLIAILGK